MPIIGWMWYFLEMVFCKRKWEEDRKTVMQGLLNLRDYPEKFWVNIGTTVALVQGTESFKKTNIVNLECGTFYKCQESIRKA